MGEPTVVKKRNQRTNATFQLTLQAFLISSATSGAPWESSFANEGDTADITVLAPWLQPCYAHHRFVAANRSILLRNNGYASPKPNKFKKVIDVFVTNKEWSLPSRNNLQQKQCSPHFSFEYNNQNLKILSPFLSVLQNHFFRKTPQFLRPITNWLRYKRTFILIILWPCID